MQCAHHKPLPLQILWFHAVAKSLTLILKIEVKDTFLSTNKSLNESINPVLIVTVQRTETTTPGEYFLAEISVYVKHHTYAKCSVFTTGNCLCNILLCEILTMLHLNKI